ncbi:MAG: Abi family protein [Alphaproteobacteria bacterium]
MLGSGAFWRSTRDYEANMYVGQSESALQLTIEQMQAIERALSRDRLKTYMKAAGFDRSMALALYIWNERVAESLHFPLSTCEVSLRNATSIVISSYYGSEWHNDNTFLSQLPSRYKSDVDNVKSRCNKRGVTLDTSRVVSELSFGFWVNVLGRRYDMTLWRNNIYSAFPNAEQGTSLKMIHTRANAIRGLRNRIAHLEPLLGRDLSLEHTHILEFISWICPQTAQWVNDNSDFQSVIRQRPSKDPRR